MRRSSSDNGADPLPIPKDRWADRAFYVFFALVAATVLLTFRDYGYSWDEISHNRAQGQAVLRFFATLGADTSSLRTSSYPLYGGLFDTLAELLARVSPLEPRNARHLANVLAGLLCLWGTRNLGRAVGGSWAGFWAALFLAACAPFYGHMFINPKDIPFAAGTVWSLFFLHRVSLGFPRPPLRDRLLFGLALGLTLGVRVGGALIVLYAALLGLSFLVERLRPGGSSSGIGREAWSMARSLLPSLLLSYVLMLAFWPAALLRPFSAPWEAAMAFQRFDLPIKVLWRGQWIPAPELPWQYLPTVFAVELPELLVVLLPLAVAWVVYSLAKALRRGPWDKAMGLGLLLLAALFPPAWALATHAVLFDNMRHFLFILPPLCCLGGAAWAAALEASSRRFLWAEWALGAAMVAALAVPAVRAASLHPYEYTYKNAFAGGIPAAARRFETDYWGTSYREAARIVLDHSRKVERLSGGVPGHLVWTVMASGSEHGVREDLPDGFKVYSWENEGKIQRADYLITSTRWMTYAAWPDYPVIGTVERGGMTFAVVKASPELAALAPPDDAEALRRKWSFSEPLAQFQEALLGNPGSADAHNGLGLLFLNHERLDEASQHFSEALALNPNHADALFNRGNLLAMQGDVRGSISCYERALRQKPDNADAHYNLGNAWLAVENLQNAIEAYRQALRHAPEHFEAHFNLGSVLGMTGRKEEAAVHLRAALTLARRSRQPEKLRNVEAALERYDIR